MTTITIQDWGAIVGMLSAIITGLYFVHKDFSSRQLRYRQLLNGEWSNEGCVGGDPESHYVQISLTVDEEDGSISGILHSRELANDEEMIFGVDGDIWFKAVKLRATKVRMGNVHEYGIVKLKFLNKRNLSFKSTTDPNNFFPRHTVIFRTDIPIDGGLEDL